MKLPDFPLRSRNSRNYQKIKTIREPLYTLPEIADRLGVEYDILKSYIRGKRPIGCPPSPTAVMVTGGSSPARMRTQLYKLSECRAWWKLRMDAIDKEKP